MSDYTSGNINFAGLGSGTDFSTMIDGLIKLERVHVNRLESWKSSWEAKVEKFQELETKLLSLQTTLKSIDTLDEFMTKAVSSSNSDILTATADSQAIVTSHTVEINQLAQNDQLVGYFGTTTDTEVIFSNTGTFTFSYGGESVTLSNIPAGTTLQGFISMVNNHADTRDKIRASTINDGDLYHLQIYGLDLGADHRIVISNTSGMIFPDGNLIHSQNAVNSQIKVDGYPYIADYWIERDTNSIDDVIDGLTLNLKNTTPAGSPITVGITVDNEGIKENIQNFVDINNEIRSMIKDMTAITTNSDKAEGSILTGNYGVELLVGQRLKDIISSRGLGFGWYTENPDGSTSGDLFSSLAQLGILTNADSDGPNMGLLELDTDELNEALEEDPTAVAMLFAANYAGSSSSPNVQYLSCIKGTTQPGEYNIQYEVSGGALVSATINGQSASVNPSTWEITAAAGTEAAGMAIRVENHSDGVFGNSDSSASDAINVYLKLGKTGEMVKALGDMLSEEGPLHILEDNYNDIMDNIDKKIAREERRIDNKEQMLKDRYSRLDTLLGQYQKQSSSLVSSINELSKA